jgi:hypothetical protein
LAGCSPHAGIQCTGIFTGAQLETIIVALVILTATLGEIHLKGHCDIRAGREQAKRFAYQRFATAAKAPGLRSLAFPSAELDQEYDYPSGVEQ